MGIELHTTTYGPAAHLALKSAVAEAKAGDPLAPVGVIVANNYVGVATRRALARAGGVAAVTFLTTYRLAELLGAGRLAAEGRRPVSTPVLAGAVRSVLAETPGHFAGVETHPTTERALVSTHRELADVSELGLKRLAATSSRAADVVRIHHAVTQRLAPSFFTEHDLFGAAGLALQNNTSVRSDIGPLVLFLPQYLTPSAAQLFVQYSAEKPVTVVAGITGAVDADEMVITALSRLGIPGDAIAEPPAPAARPAQIVLAVSLSDADDEVRHGIRSLVDAVRTGTPANRCAVVYATRDPYARLLADGLASAEIEWFGASVRTADRSLLGRSLIDLLALPDHDLSRRDVAAWLASAQVFTPDGGLAPGAAWERASRAAGVVAGAAQWESRLTRLAADLDHDAAEFESSEEMAWRAERARIDSGHATALAGFMATLDSDLRRGHAAGSWAEMARWCQSLIGRYLGREATRDRWPDDQRRAAELVEAAIERLADLDSVDSSPSVVAFRRALTLELENDLGRHGRFGQGVMVGPVSLAIGADLDHIVVLGMAEGTFPSRPRDDSLLPDRERRVAGPELALRAARIGDDHRALLAIRATASSLVLSTPRGDLRRNADRVPSRWLDADPVSVPSFVAGMRDTAFPVSPQEYDTCSLLDYFDRGQPVDSNPAVAARPLLSRSIECVRARAGSSFTRFDGNLAHSKYSDLVIASPASDGPRTSATRLQTWARCPHAYLVRYVLGVSAIDEPDETYQITALDRGSLVHAILDDWLGEMIASGSVPKPHQPWPNSARVRLTEIANRHCDGLSARGLAGRTLFWKRDRHIILADIEGFLVADNQLRHELRSTPLDTETTFGMGASSNPATAIELPSGRTIALQGSIDRLDQTNEGLVVIDYKTGSDRGYRGLNADDPAPGGSHLQLGLYAIAARALLGLPDAKVDAYYWMITSKGQFGRFGYAVTPAVQTEVLSAVDAIVTGIEAGVFTQVPPEPKFMPFTECRYCDPDEMGTGERYRDWERKALHPELLPYHLVASPESMRSRS